MIVFLKFQKVFTRNLAFFSVLKNFDVSRYDSVALNPRYGASLGLGNEKLLKWSRSIDQDGHHAHIW